MTRLYDEDGDDWEDIDTQEDLDEDAEPGICSSCNGSGEGMYDGSRCRTCGGSGEV